MKKRCRGPFRFRVQGEPGERFLTQLSAPDGQRSTWSVIVFESAGVRSIQGFNLGRKTAGSPRAQMPLCTQRSGFQITVTSPLV